VVLARLNRLQPVAVAAGSQISAARFNAAVDAIERLLNIGWNTRDDAADYPHPFRVSVSRMADDPRKWSVKILPGTVNDELVVFPDAALDRNPFASPTPFLTAIAPEGDALHSFTAVGDAQRPELFRTAAMWERDLFVAHVVISAQPSHLAFYFPGLPQRLRRFRYFVGKRPPVTYGAGSPAGGIITIARLWLVREKNDDPAADQLHVEQIVCRCLASTVVTPHFELPEFTELGIGFIDALRDIVQQNLDNTLADAASVEFWSV